METENKDVQVTEETKVDETTEKTYTHIDVDNSFKAGYKKAKTEFEKSEDYKKYKEWEKSNQNDSEKINELQSSLDKLTKENQLLKATNEVAKSDVKPEFIKFVTSEVMNMVNDTTDFETALKEYKKSSPQFFGEIVVKKVQSSPNLAGGTQPSTVDDIFNNMIRNA